MIRTKKEDRVYFGTCPQCKKGKINKKNQGKNMLCSDCDVTFDGSLMSQSLATSLLAKAFR